MHNEAWTAEADDLLARLRTVERLSAKAIAARIGRTPAATSARLLKLGIKVHTRELWDAGSVDRLRALVADRSVSVRAAARLLGRTECSVRWKIDDLGLQPGRLRPWTRAEDARAAAAAGSGQRALRALASEIGRSYEALRARQVALGHRTRVSWDGDAEDALRALVARGASADDAAAGLGRPAGAVRAKAYALGLRFVPAATVPAPWTAEADAMLRAHDGSAGGLGRLMDALGRSERAVRDRLRFLGVAAVVRPAKVRRAQRPAVAARRPEARPAATAPAAVRRIPEAPRAVSAAVARYLPGRPRPRPAADGRAAAELRAGMDDAIARFVRERGVNRGAPDPVEELVRRVRSRGYSVTSTAEGGFVVDARLAVVDAEALRTFARERGIDTEEAGLALAE